MAIQEEVAINVRLNNDDVKKKTDEATTSSKNFASELNRVKKEVESGDLSFRQLSKKIQEYQSIALKAGRTSPVGKEALLEAANLQDEMTDLRNEVTRLSQDGQKLQGALQLGTTVVAGYTSFQGVTAALGVENENLQKTFVKLQAAQSVLLGVETIRANLEKESQLRIQASILLDKAKAASTALIATVTGTATGALKVFRIALISTGIGALIVGLGLLVANFEKVTNFVGKAISKFREMPAPIKLLFSPITALIALFDGVVVVLEKLGIIDDDVTKNQKANAQQRINLAQSELATKTDLLDFEIAKRKAAGEQTKEIEAEKRKVILKNVADEIQAINELARLNGEKTDEQKERIKELQKLFVETSRANILATIEENKALDDLRKENFEKVKAERERLRVEKEKELLEEIKREDDQFKLLNELRLTDKEKEIQAVNEEFDRKFEIAQGNAELEKELMIAQQQAINEIEDNFFEEKLAKEEEKAIALAELKLKLKEELATGIDENSSVEEVEAHFQERLELENAQFDIEMQRLQQQLSAKQITEEEFLLKKKLAETQTSNDIKNIKKEQIDFEMALEKKKQDNLVALQKQMFSTTIDLLGKGSALGKTAAVAQATIDTSKAAIAAYAAGASVGPAGVVLGPLSAGLAIAAGIKNVKEILAVKTPGGGGGGSVPNIQPPQPIDIQQPQQQQQPFNPSTQSSQVQVVVLDSELQEVRSRNEQNNTLARII